MNDSWHSYLFQGSRRFTRAGFGCEKRPPAEGGLISLWLLALDAVRSWESVAINKAVWDLTIIVPETLHSKQFGSQETIRLTRASSSSIVSGHNNGRGQNHVD